MGEILRIRGLVSVVQIAIRPQKQAAEIDAADGGESHRAGDQAHKEESEKRVHL
jgi:hypothetical protein